MICKQIASNTCSEGFLMNSTMTRNSSTSLPRPPPGPPRPAWPCMQQACCRRVILVPGRGLVLVLCPASAHTLVTGPLTSWLVRPRRGAQLVMKMRCRCHVIKLSSSCSMSALQLLLAQLVVLKAAFLTPLAVWSEAFKSYCIQLGHQLAVHLHEWCNCVPAKAYWQPALCITMLLAGSVNNVWIAVSAGVLVIVRISTHNCIISINVADVQMRWTCQLECLRSACWYANLGGSSCLVMCSTSGSGCGQLSG